MPTKKEILKHRIKSRRRNRRDSFFLSSESEQLSSVSVENQDITSSPKALRVNNQNTPISISKDKALYDKSPTEDSEIANKKYVDDNAGGGDMTGVDLTGGTGISIASETGTTSGDYSATLNFDGDVTAGGNSFAYINEGPYTYWQNEHDNPYWVLSEGGTAILSNQWRHAFIASASNSTYYLYSPAANADYATLSAGANGALQISTFDSSGADGDLELDIDGDIIIDSDTGNFISKKGGTEFSAANSAYAGMILGYTCLRNYGATGDTITIGTSMTVLQTAEGNDVKVTFTAPPSGNVEIEFSAAIRGTSKTVRCALSDNATFNELNEIHTYDNKCITIDETDAYVNHIKWVVTGLTAGTSYTYFIAAKSSTASSYIDHGENRFGLHSPPIIVKSTALPATILTGE
jgi:hypothetical protein